MSHVEKKLISNFCAWACTDDVIFDNAGNSLSRAKITHGPYSPQLSSARPRHLGRLP